MTLSTPQMGKSMPRKVINLMPLFLKNFKTDSVKKLFIDSENLFGSFLSKDIFDKKTGIIFLNQVMKLQRKH